MGRRKEDGGGRRKKTGWLREEQEDKTNEEGQRGTISGGRFRTFFSKMYFVRFFRGRETDKGEEDGQVDLVCRRGFSLISLGAQAQ